MTYWRSVRPSVHERLRPLPGDERILAALASRRPRSRGAGYRFHGLPLLLTRFAVRIVHFIMQRKQLLGSRGAPRPCLTRLYLASEAKVHAKPLRRKWHRVEKA